MTPDIEALVARLERDSDTDDVFSKAAYALRRQAREIERLTKQLEERAKVWERWGPALAVVEAERDALQARVRELQQYHDWAAPQIEKPIDEKINDENNALRAENESLRKQLQAAQVKSGATILMSAGQYAMTDSIDSPQAPLK